MNVILINEFIATKKKMSAGDDLDESFDFDSEWFIRTNKSQSHWIQDELGNTNRDHWYLINRVSAN